MRHTLEIQPDIIGHEIIILTMPESDYLWKRDKSPDFSEKPFTH